MGEKTTIGYERPDPASSAYHPVTVSNPYHKEFLRGADKTYDVFYYFSHIQRADGIISSDELTPLVFEKDILIGKGWDFLEQTQGPENPRSKDIYSCSARLFLIIRSSALSLGMNNSAAAPLEVEIGSGLGEFLIRSALAHPRRDYVGIELNWERICKTLTRIMAERQRGNWRMSAC